MVKTRFAPSPTGRLHVGNIRVALLNYLFTKKHGGHFMLRMDDTDAERSTEAFAEGIKQDMQWLGMEWDSTDAQSNQQARYDAAIEKLKTDGRLYPCYETPEDLDLKRRALLNQGKPPIYDRASLNLSEQEKQDLEAQGITPHWRFKLNHEDITWTDLVRGDAHFHGSKLSDPVLIRANGRPIYTLSSVVDDITFDITHVIRGEDH
ncbi:MAG: glutamate--tRNA ligase family protein, partial [Cyanobacteria bacterium J06649_11]